MFKLRIFSRIRKKLSKIAKIKKTSLMALTLSFTRAEVIDIKTKRIAATDK